MPDSLIERLIGELAEWDKPFFFSPFKVNEPLLDKRLMVICETVLEHTIAEVRLFSNGSALTPRLIDKIGQLSRVNHLWISLNEHRPEEYKNLMNLDFENTAKKLDVLHKTDFPHPVVLSTVGFPNEEFQRYCFDRWPKFTTVVIAKSGWLGFTDAQEITVPDTGCYRWFELSICADGKVSLCCMDGEAEFSIGDVKKNSMLDVYASTKDRRLGMSRLDVYPCSTCTY